MLSRPLKKRTQKLLKEADIRIGGNNPWDIQIFNDKFYPRVFSEGALGLGETYMNGWWECEQLDVFFYRILDAKIDRHFHHNIRMFWDYIRAFFMNLQNSNRAFEVGQQHYDRDNDLYKAMLDDRLVYTCGYWRNADNLNDAQEAKLDLVCQKLDLKPGQSVLDIGCGWGSFAKFAAERYDVEVTGVTVSKKQVELGRKWCKGLPVEFLLQDYRNVKGQFDHIVSLGMFEHVGYKNYGTFMQIAREHLKDDGLFLLHCIGGNQSVRTSNPWTTKYIFPNSMIPSISQIGDAIEKLFVMEDWHNFGPNYDRTLMAWFQNFDESWSDLKTKYPEHFYRMWKYYLLSAAGGFRARRLQLWQVVLSPQGLADGYTPPRYRSEAAAHPASSFNPNYSRTNEK